MTLLHSTQSFPVHVSKNAASLLHFTAPPAAGLQVCVIVPVRNEAAHLSATLTALYQQVDAAGRPLDKNCFEVLLLANNCTDHSAASAEEFRNRHPDFRLQVAEINLAPDKANIGTVRRMLMDEACRRLTNSNCLNGIIASTDGDTTVDKRWVYATMQEIANGADAVGGRILTQNDQNCPVRLYHLQNVMYRSLLAHAEAIIDPHPCDPWPRHFQYFGASLAVTCKAYEQAGRLPEVPYLEDHAFYQALTMIDARIRKSNAVKVYTSTRLNGRVEVGFSEQLKKWNDQQNTSQPQLVESVEAQLIKIRCRVKLRQCRNEFIQTGTIGETSFSEVGRQLMLPLGWLKKRLENTLYFGQLWHRTEQELHERNWNEQWQPIPVLQAITALRRFVNEAPPLYKSHSLVPE